MSIFSQFLDSMVIRIIFIVIVCIIVYFLIKRFGRNTVRSALTKGKATVNHEQQQRIDTLSIFFDRIARLFLLVAVAVLILAEAGVNIGPLLAGVGVIGIAVGFGAQSLVKDFFAGVFIVIENQYSKGDIVELSGIRGKVVDFSLRRTVLRDMDGTEHTVPNGEISRSANFTKDWSNINLDIPVNSTNSLNEVYTILADILESFAKDPEWKVFMYSQPTVLGIESFNNPGIIVKLHGKVDADQKWSIERELRKRIKLAFDDADISTPYTNPLPSKQSTTKL